MREEKRKEKRGKNEKGKKTLDWKKARVREKERWEEGKKRKTGKEEEIEEAAVRKMIGSKETRRAHIERKKIRKK